jgi:hypothetical protein
MAGNAEQALNLENFRSHVSRAKEAGQGEDQQCFMFHAHSIGDCTDPATKAALEKWYAFSKA